MEIPALINLMYSISFWMGFAQKRRSMERCWCVCACTRGRFPQCLVSQWRRWASLFQAGVCSKPPMIYWPQLLCCAPPSPAAPTAPSESRPQRSYSPNPAGSAQAFQSGSEGKPKTHPHSSPGSRYLSPSWLLWWACWLRGPTRSQLGWQQFPLRSFGRGLQPCLWQRCGPEWWR